MKLVLGNKTYSSWSIRGWLIARSTGLAFDEVVIPLYQPDSKAEILKYAPNGLVPCLIDGAVTVWDTLAILEYLNEKAPEAGLYPPDPAERARDRSICAEIHSGFANLRDTCTVNLRRKPVAIALTPEIAAEIERLKEIVAILHNPTSRKDAMPAVEAFLTPIATRFRSYGLPMDGGLEAYFSALLGHPLFREWETAAAQEPWTIAQYDNQ